MPGKTFYDKNGMVRSRLNYIYEKTDKFFENSEKYNLTKRAGQNLMALSVFDSIESKDHLIIEAGVGIGKSYAYLVPLLYYHNVTNESFIVSTSTIALQEQLEKDVHNLSKQLGIPTEVVVAKGKNNFLCKDRLTSFLNNPQNIEYKNIFDETKQDRKDYSNVKDIIWNQINVNDCCFNKCHNCMSCDFMKTRRMMRQANGIIICNHDLLIEDLSRIDNKLIKSVRYIVVDEAHNLENKIRNYHTTEINFKRDLYKIRGLIEFLNRRNNYNYDYEDIRRKIEKLSLLIDKSILETISKLQKENINLEDYNGLELNFSSDILDLVRKIDEVIHKLTFSVKIQASLHDKDVDFDVLRGLENNYSSLSLGKKSSNLFWIERRNNKNIICYAPKYIDEIANNLLFQKKDKTFIFTSATLCTNKGNYDYFIHNIGAEEVQNINIEDSYESPYDYDNNSIVYCCDDIESPKNKEKYLDELVYKIKELILLTHGKTMVLFTSKSDMNYVYEKIGNKLEDIDIYIQNDGSSQDIVKEKFKNEINSVLFSTGIFWEGIDIKGKSLSNLIIARLPFPVVDPIIEYKSSQYEDGFNSVYLPEMLIKLKQGVGRLIRSEDDKGIICILDSRIKKYEDKVKDVIPQKKLTYKIGDIKKFINDNIN